MNPLKPPFRLMCDLVSLSTRLPRTGERQVAASLEDIRVDHRGRYEFASDRLPSSGRVLDAACGVGYGCRILVDDCPERILTGIDRDRLTIRFAKRHHASSRIVYRVGDLSKDIMGENLYDAATSFETIEHLETPTRFLQQLNRALREDALLIASVPNEDVMRFHPRAYPFHYRHYRPSELSILLERAGFSVLEKWSQTNNASRTPLPGWHGRFLLAVCVKQSTS
jgi:2-polyprenyl-3-methyl-5-hydroxy-6-metoxy-1,4-benzoquinol methylase